MANRLPHRPPSCQARRNGPTIRTSRIANPGLIGTTFRAGLVEEIACEIVAIGGWCVGVAGLLVFAGLVLTIG